MTLEQYAAVAEIIGGMAVLVTLIYLVVELKKSNRLALAESRRATMSHTTQLGSLIGQSDEISAFFYEALVDYDSLSPARKLRFDFLFSVLGGHGDLAWTDFELGFTDQTTFEHSTSVFMRLLKTPAGKNFWAMHGQNFTTGFRQHVDKWLNE